jgi:hypothetical protein
VQRADLANQSVDRIVSLLRVIPVDIQPRFDAFLK